MVAGRPDGAGCKTSKEIVWAGSSSPSSSHSTFEIERGEGNAFKLEETMATDALLLGRVTYEEFAKAWPSRDGEFADKLNSLPKHVVSSTLERPAWNNTTVLKGDLGEEVTKLKKNYDGDIVVHGSAQLTQALIEHDLVDELRLMVFPVVLGSGKRLFGASADKKRLELVETRTVGDGVLILTYARPALADNGTDAR
jgi:dihydrofolate reductase